MTAAATLMANITANITAFAVPPQGGTGAEATGGGFPDWGIAAAAGAGALALIAAGGFLVRAAIRRASNKRAWQVDHTIDVDVKKMLGALAGESRLMPLSSALSQSAREEEGYSALLLDSESAPSDDEVYITPEEILYQGLCEDYAEPASVRADAESSVEGDYLEPLVRACVENIRAAEAQASSTEDYAEPVKPETIAQVLLEEVVPEFEKLFSDMYRDARYAAAFRAWCRAKKITSNDVIEELFKKYQALCQHAASASNTSKATDSALPDSPQEAIFKLQLPVFIQNLINQLNLPTSSSQSNTVLGVYRQICAQEQRYAVQFLNSIQPQVSESDQRYLSERFIRFVRKRTLQLTKEVAKEQDSAGAQLAQTHRRLSCTELTMGQTESAAIVVQLRNEEALYTELASVARAATERPIPQREQARIRRAAIHATLSRVTGQRLSELAQPKREAPVEAGQPSESIALQGLFRRRADYGVQAIQHNQCKTRRFEEEARVLEEVRGKLSAATTGMVEATPRDDGVRISMVGTAPPPIPSMISLLVHAARMREEQQAQQEAKAARQKTPSLSRRKSSRRGAGSSQLPLGSSMMDYDSVAPSLLGVTGAAVPLGTMASSVAPPVTEATEEPDGGASSYYATTLPPLTRCDTLRRADGPTSTTPDSPMSANRATPPSLPAPRKPVNITPPRTDSSGSEGDSPPRQLPRHHPDDDYARPVLVLPPVKLISSCIPNG